MSGLKVIGLTGGSGSGKGVVCEIFKRLGAYIIDTDSIAHDIILKGKPAYFEILEKFGDEFLDDDGEIIRRRLSAIVFEDTLKLEELTKITHKYIIEQAVSEIDNIQRNANGFRFIVIDAPLLIEANMQSVCDAVWVVWANCETRVSRIVSRDKISSADAMNRIGRQMPLEELRQYADLLIENNGTITELENEVEGYLNCFMPSRCEA